MNPNIEIVVEPEGNSAGVGVVHLPNAALLVEKLQEVADR